MFVCTNKLDTLAKRAFGPNNVFISSVDKMCTQFQIDPSLSTIAKEAYMITDQDITRKNLDEFLRAAKQKHPSTVIIYIARRGKSEIKAGNGIDLVLEKPRPEQLRDAVLNLVKSVTQKGQVISSADTVPETVEEFSPETEGEQDTLIDAYGRALEISEQEPEEEQEEIEDMISELDKVEIELEPEPVKPIEESTEMTTVDRIKACGTFADLTVLAREISSAQVVKEVIATNMEYVAIEDRLKALREKFLAIELDSSIPSQEEKLDRMKAVVYDQDYYKAKSDTILEKRTIELIETVIDKAKECIKIREDELIKVMNDYKKRKEASSEISYARLSGITDERANLLLELSTLRAEAQEMIMRINKTGMDIASQIARKDFDRTDSPLLNDKLSLYVSQTDGANTVAGLLELLNTVEEADENFVEVERTIVKMEMMLNKIVDLDKENIAMLTQVITALRANNIEDTVIKKTLIKTALRVFVGKPGSGKTVVPYVCSQIASRKNENVLYVDLTGSSKIKNYGGDFYTLDDWMDNRYEKKFCVVVGEMNNSADAAQRLLTALTRAVDYYSIVNVVISPEQREILDVLVPDAVVTNYILNPTQEDIDFYKSYIKDTHYDNTAQRIIVNKCRHNLFNAVIEGLNVAVDLNIHATQVPDVPNIVECGLNKVKPYELVAVQEAFAEVCRKC